VDLFTYESISVYRVLAQHAGIFHDYTGGLVGNQDDIVLNHSGNEKVLNGFLNVPTEDDVELHPICVLEGLGNDSRAVALEDTLRKFRTAEVDLFGNNIVPLFINLDCGLNLLVAFLVGLRKQNLAKQSSFRRFKVKQYQLLPGVKFSFPFQLAPLPLVRVPVREA